MHLSIIIKKILLVDVNYLSYIHNSYNLNNKSYYTLIIPESTLNKFIQNVKT